LARLAQSLTLLVVEMIVKEVVVGQGLGLAFLIFEVERENELHKSNHRRRKKSSRQYSLVVSPRAQGATKVSNESCVPLAIYGDGYELQMPMKSLASLGSRNMRTQRVWELR
jgi:hypothetical protein